MRSTRANCLEPIDLQEVSSAQRARAPARAVIIDYGSYNIKVVAFGDLTCMYQPELTSLLIKTFFREGLGRAVFVHFVISIAIMVLFDSA